MWLISLKLNFIRPVVEHFSKEHTVLKLSVSQFPLWVDSCRLGANIVCFVSGSVMMFGDNFMYPGTQHRIAS